MRIAFLLGAGCPVSIQIADGTVSKPLIPDISGLTALVNGELLKLKAHQANYTTLLNRLTGGATSEPDKGSQREESHQRHPGEGRIQVIHRANWAPAQLPK